MSHSSTSSRASSLKPAMTLEQPTICSDRDQTSQQTIENHPLAIPRYLRSHPRGALLEPPLKALAERRGIPIPHAVVSVKIRSMNRRDRSSRSAAATRRHRGVVNQSLADGEGGKTEAHNAATSTN